MHQIICSYSLTLVILLGSIVSGTRESPAEPILQIQNEPPQNSCLGNSKDGNCRIEHPLETTYSYDPTNLDLTALGSQSFDGYEYANDRLSDADQLFFKSKDASYWQASEQETLMQVLIVHRHGDRTPINFPPKDNLINEPFWQFHGLGQLTNRGKARLHLLGKIIRQRYNSFLNGTVNKNIRKSRASGSLRCIESSQVFLSSFLSLDTRDNSDARSLIWDGPADQLAQLWQPASVLTLSAKYDGMLNEGATCKKLDEEFVALDNHPENKKLHEEFKHEAKVLKDELDFDIDHFYKWFWAASVLEVERSYFEEKMKPTILAIYDRLQEAGDRALILYQSTLKTRRLRAGLLANDIINNMIEVRDSSPSPYTKKFVHYSGHDITIVFLLGLIDNIDKFSHRPDYASNMVFELHQDQNEWFIKIFYMPHVPSEPIELHIDNCEKSHPKYRCTLDKFNDLMQIYKIPSWASWMQECANSMNDFDPYCENS